MKFGLFLMPEPFPWSNWTLSYDLKLEEIAYAERFGYDEVWVGEHHTGAYENIPAPDIFIAKASALTSRIALGTGTINLPYHDPFMVAERLAFLDHLTHGRLIYGFGGGGLVLAAIALLVDFALQVPTSAPAPSRRPSAGGPTQPAQAVVVVFVPSTVIQLPLRSCSSR